MVVEFAKYSAAGNDFLVVADSEAFKRKDLSQWARTLVDRHEGVPADGVVVVSPEPGKDGSFGFRILNADGSEAAISGNGLRVAGHHLARKHGSKGEYAFATKVGVRTVRVARLSSDGSLADGLADMGKVAGKRFFLDAYLERALSCPQATFEVDVGNRHLVALYLPGVPAPALEEVKGALAQDFLAAFNLELASIVSGTEVRIEVHEIGVGPTLACGSGSVAVAWAGREGGFLSERVSVLNPGGTLEVALDGDSAWLSGPSRLVAEGVVHLQ